ncbi:hypothetical protein HYW59_00065 [Candidatus Kaiserbacteria bacterium]|nr:hypothetical protein [Candidatus Kaiserbacteria bacterium]
MRRGSKYIRLPAGVELEDWDRKHPSRLPIHPQDGLPPAFVSLKLDFGGQARKVERKRGD